MDRNLLFSWHSFMNVNLPILHTSKGRRLEEIPAAAFVTHKETFALMEGGLPGNSTPEGKAMQVNKVKTAAWMQAVAAVASALLIASAAGKDAPAAEVKTCRVETGNVEVITALTGALRNNGEFAALCPSTGLVEAVYVEQGDKVCAGQPLFRMDATVQEAAVTAAIRRKTWAGSLDAPAMALAVDAESALQVEQSLFTLECLTVRAGADGVVQQVIAREQSGLQAGTPGVMMTGGGQEVVCYAVLRDAELLVPGMQARIIHRDEPLCIGTVWAVGDQSVQNGRAVCEVIVVPEEEILLPLGTQLTAEVVRASAENVPVLPVEAVADDGTVRWVSAGRCYKTPVTVLLESETLCWVDLAQGTQVVLSGEDTSDGQRVREGEP